MSAPARPLNFIDHGQIKIKPTRHFPHVQGQQIVPLIIHEFSSAAAEMPVVFVKNAETGSFQPVAIMGFEEGENLFYGEPKWRGHYVPAAIMHHPFALMPSKEDANNLQVILIETDTVMAETDGEALFKEDGTETEYMAKRKNALGTYYENMHITTAFVDFLKEKELLVEQTLNIDINEQKRQLSGLYLVDEKKLNALSDEDFGEVRRRGYLPSIYAHMLSVHQLNRLATLKTQK
ncbi:SapC family protein [Thalassotalea atypica]|uniref:SapC family protein n=1 Tax=Thalassotalea atypica TaxID=2054316 RepID=UPI00257372A7|nr:SapC family protein [Thalassotalea atypica]